MSFQSLFDKCVLWWPGYDLTTFPIIPSGVTATPNGTFSNDLTLPNGKKVKTFDGSTNYISLTDNDAWDLIASDFTICAWAYLSVKGSTLNGIVGQTTTLNVSTYIWGLYLNASGKLTYYAHNGTVSNAHYYATTDIIPTSGWNYITFIKSGTSALMYYNGNTITVTNNTTWNGTLTLTSPLYIGNYYIADSTCLWNGNIANLTIFKGRALTQPEIRMIMNYTNPSNLYNFQPTSGYYR